MSEATILAIIVALLFCDAWLRARQREMWALARLKSVQEEADQRFADLLEVASAEDDGNPDDDACGCGEVPWRHLDADGHLPHCPAKNGTEP